MQILGHLAVFQKTMESSFFTANLYPNLIAIFSMHATENPSAIWTLKNRPDFQIFEAAFSLGTTRACPDVFDHSQLTSKIYKSGLPFWVLI